MAGLAWDVIASSDFPPPRHRVSVLPEADDPEAFLVQQGQPIMKAVPRVDAYQKTKAALRDRERELSQLIDMVPSHPLAANSGRRADFLQQAHGRFPRPGRGGYGQSVGGARALQIRSRRDGLDAIRIEVRDAGTGFKDAERALEPFFTTKPNGMGMGLAICRSIVEAHGGRLRMGSNGRRATVSSRCRLRRASP